MLFTRLLACNPLNFEAVNDLLDAKGLCFTLRDLSYRIIAAASNVFPFQGRLKNFIGGSIFAIDMVQALKDEQSPAVFADHLMKLLRGSGFYLERWT